METKREMRLRSSRIKCRRKKSSSCSLMLYCAPPFSRSPRVPVHKHKYPIRRQFTADTSSSAQIRWQFFCRRCVFWWFFTLCCDQSNLHNPPATLAHEKGFGCNASKKTGICLIPREKNHGAKQHATKTTESTSSGEQPLFFLLMLRVFLVLGAWKKEGAEWW